MPRKESKFGLEFRKKFNYFGKLTKKEMGSELWNEYNKALSKARTNSDEHKEVLKQRRIERSERAKEKAKERKLRGEYLKVYCCDDYTKIENYEAAKADKFINWQCHHRLETHNSDGERRLVDLTCRELDALDMYWKRPASELILLPMKEHRRLHLCGKPGLRTGKYKR